MELEIATPSVPDGSDSGPTLPGWSKTGRRTRTTRGARHQMQQQGPAAVASDDEAREFTILESNEFVIESLPPKKRKLLQPCCEAPVSKNKKHFMCNICGRSFSSYQALGGHKAHHNSNDQKAEDGDAVVGSFEPPGGGGGGAEHRCTFCYKVFSKGQALGGHRRHCQRPTVAENQEKMFSFDLNELPPDWLES